MLINRPTSVCLLEGWKMARTANQHDSKKAELVAISEKLFLEKGYGETSIDDILEAATISKGGFYHYFKSKEEVLSESIRTVMSSIRSELEPIVMNENLDALSKLRLFMERKTELKRPKAQFAAYLGMLMKSDFTIYKFYLSLAREYVDPLTRIIEQGAREGVFDVSYPRETADILLGAVTSLPQSTLYAEYVSDETTRLHYATALLEVISKVLGIDSKELRI
jgi:AcrR family transcriptional regulator